MLDELSVGNVESIPDEEWSYDFDLKVMAAVRLIRLVLPHMRVAQGGSIVNILHFGAKAPWAGSLPTSASRAAGLALTKALSKELAAENIRVNAILIGSMESADRLVVALKRVEGLLQSILRRGRRDRSTRSRSGPARNLQIWRPICCRHVRPI